MKRFIPTIILVLVCIGGFWYASSQNFFREEATDLVGKTLLTVNKEDITAAKLKNGQDSIELTHKDGKWTMVKPSELPMSDYDADSWAGSFVNITQDGEVDANPSDLAGFGLQSPAQEYEITLKDGSVKAVQVGNPLPISGYYYVKLKDAPAVYKVAEQTVQSLAKAPMDFMKKQPVSLTYSDVQGISLTWKGASKTLTKSDASKTASESDWKLGDQVMKGVDASAFMDKILMLATEQQAKPTSSVKLDNPELKLEVKLKTDGKDSTDVYTGKIDGENVWVAKQGDTWAYSVPATAVQEMVDAMQPQPQPQQ